MKVAGLFTTLSWWVVHSCYSRAYAAPPWLHDYALAVQGLTAQQQGQLTRVLVCAYLLLCLLLSLQCRLTRWAWYPLGRSS
jgi:hypothetical protein